MLILLAAAFLTGSIPFAYLAVRLALGEDVREHRSGNPGATNAARLWSKRWQPVAFLVVFVLDAGKGIAAVALLPGLLHVAHADGPAAAGLAAVLGHIFSPFLKLRGGKGVATTVGVLLALAPVSGLIAIAAFVAVVLKTRIVAAGSLAIAVTAPAAVALRGEPTPTIVVTIWLGILILARHRTNIESMLRRTA